MAPATPTLAHDHRERDPGHAGVHRAGAGARTPARRRPRRHLRDRLRRLLAADRAARLQGDTPIALVMHHAQTPPIAAVDAVGNADSRRARRARAGVPGQEARRPAAVGERAVAPARERSTSARPGPTSGRANGGRSTNPRTPACETLRAEKTPQRTQSTQRSSANASHAAGIVGRRIAAACDAFADICRRGRRFLRPLCLCASVACKARVDSAHPPRRTGAEILLGSIHDENVNIRYWAVEGLAYLATDAAIAPLLDVFHDDPSPMIRERAACGLAQSGMFSAAQRLTAVPRLLDFAERRRPRSRDAHVGLSGAARHHRPDPAARRGGVAQVVRAASDEVRLEARKAAAQAKVTKVQG